MDTAARVLLLKNERDEWELPGGRIEIGEETQWKVKTGPILDTWMYYIAVAEKHVFIATYGCYPEVDVEPVLSHEHKEVGLFTAAEVARLTMPEGYRRSIATWLELTARDAR